MELGVNLPTHGVITRDADGDAMLQEVPPLQMKPVERAVRAEQLGYASIWLSDHVVTERTTTNDHPANVSGKRPYPVRPPLLDVPTTLAAIASRTTKLRLAPSVYIAPYRHPLITAHEFATIDVLSGGRALLAVGIGWEKGEFAALGVEFDDRGSITEESIEIYKQAWTRQEIDYSGKHFDIHDVSMDPKPVQKPHIPIWYGGVTKVAARRAARHCAALFPMFLDAWTTPENHAALHDEVKREADRIGRDLTGFIYAGFCQAQLTDDAKVASRFRGTRPLLTGTSQQVIDGLAAFSKAGYSHLALHFDCPSATVAEWDEQLERFGAEVLPFVK